MYTIYVTPAGYTCTCGHTQSALAGGEALRAASRHADNHDRDLKDSDVDENECVIIDYRKVADHMNAIIADKDAKLASGAQAMFEAGELCATLYERLQEKQRLLDEAEAQVDRILARLER